MTDDTVLDEFLAARRIAVVGASDRPEKWGHKILRYLRERGHEVFPVNPGLTSIDGRPCYPTLDDVPRPAEGAPPVDGIDLVVNPRIGLEVARAAARLGVPRIIAQPGAESPEIAGFCRENGVAYVEACVLVEGRARRTKPPA